MIRIASSVEFCEECFGTWISQPNLSPNTFRKGHVKHKITKDYPWICSKQKCCKSFKSQGARKEHSKNCSHDSHSSNCSCEACRRLVGAGHCLMKKEQIKIEPFTNISFVSAKVSIIDRLSESLMDKELLSLFVPLRTFRDEHHLCRAVSLLQYNSEFKWPYVRVSKWNLC